MRRFSKIMESAWGDMMRRSSGDIIRKEDDVDNMDPEKFKEYLKTLYKPLVDYAFISYVSEAILVPIIRRDSNSSAWFTPDTGLITIGDDIANCTPDLLNKLEHIYMIDEHTMKLGKIYTITPKDGSEVTNSFFIEVINFLLKNIPDSGNGFHKSLEIIDKNHK